MSLKHVLNLFPKHLNIPTIYGYSDNMNGMFEFRDTSENIMAMCGRFGEYIALCDYYEAQGLALTYDGKTGITYVHNG